MTGTFGASNTGPRLDGIGEHDQFRFRRDLPGHEPRPALAQEHHQVAAVQKALYQAPFQGSGAIPGGSQAPAVQVQYDPLAQQLAGQDVDPLLEQGDPGRAVDVQHPDLTPQHQRGQKARQEAQGQQGAPHRAGIAVRNVAGNQLEPGGEPAVQYGPEQDGLPAQGGRKRPQQQDGGFGVGRNHGFCPIA